MGLARRSASRRRTAGGPARPGARRVSWRDCMAPWRVLSSAAMKRRTDRLLTTRVGSLPRPPELAELMLRREAGEHVDEAELSQRIASACRDAVQRQLAAGLDVVNDGELGRISFSVYLKDRLTSFEGSEYTNASHMRDPDFPNFQLSGREERQKLRFPYCTGPVAMKDPDAIQRDLAVLRSAVDGQQPAEVFMTAVSPAHVPRNMPNRYYPDEEAYIEALAAALAHDYKAIVDAGFILQIDCPDLGSGLSGGGPSAGLPLADRVRLAQRHLDILNEAISGLPPDRIRLHVCWGNYEGPHHRDVPLEAIIGVLLTAHVGALSIEAANPRHAHEWTVFENIKLPDGMLLIP